MINGHSPDASNYRSISNLILTGISKALERPFLSRFLAHMLEYYNFNKLRATRAVPLWLAHSFFLIGFIPHLIRFNRAFL